MSEAVDTALADRVRRVIQARVPDALIDMADDYSGRISVVVVSASFNGVPDEDRQAHLWRALRDELGDEALGVGLVLAYSTEELH